MRGPLLLLVSLCLVALSFGLPEVLTEATFDDFVKENELVLVEFYAPWCGHCKKLEPEWDSASKQLEGTGALLAKVDVTIEKKLGEDHGIQGFPTIKLFTSGVSKDYESGRTADDIVKYMKKQLGPAITPLATADDLSAFIPKEGEDPVIVGFAAADSELATFLSAFAKTKRDDFSFGLVTSADVAGDEKMGTIVIFKPFDEMKNVYEGELTSEAVGSFLTGNSMKAVDEIGPENYQKYLARGLPLCWLFYDPDSDEEKEIVEAYKTLSSFKTSLSLVYLNGVQYSQMATKMGLAKTPGMAIENSDSEHWVFPAEEEMTAENLGKWLTQYLAGEIAPTVKSEPLPDSLFDKENVATLVGDNFHEVAMDDTKDVLIEFYAPWCGHCKSLVPIWNKLGKAFKGVDSVVIAKTDATANDYPKGFKVEGFPTIKMVTSKGNNILDYNGGRTVDAFVDYLKANAATPFEMAASKAADDSDDEL